MYKKFLLSFFAMIVGFFTLSAENVMIDVDNAANVRVYSSKGDVSLFDGMNRITDLTAADSPLTIEAAPGAEIVSVTRNQSESVNPSGDGCYRVPIENMMIQIVTSGGGSVSQDVNVTVNNGNAAFGSFSLMQGTTALAVGAQTKLAPGAEITVIPSEGYEIVCVKDLFQTEVGSPNPDGTYTFAVGSEPDNWYYVDTKVSGISFTIEPDYAPNLKVTLNAVQNGAYKDVPLNSKGATTVVTKEDMQPITFEGADGAQIVSVTRNGENVPANASGFMSGFENGDVFVVTTLGKLVDYTFKAADGNAPLESYIFTTADGTALSLSGTTQTVQLHAGEKISIEGRPGTEYAMVSADISAQDMKSWIRVTDNGVATLYGTRSTDVKINVDVASRVAVTQSNGRGEVLSLSDGENKFELSAIQNALQIAPTEGNMLLSLSLNGDALTPNKHGYYLVNVEEGSYLDIKSRKKPGDVAVTFSLNEGASIEWLNATLDDKPFDLMAAMDENHVVTVKSGSVFTLTPAIGYKILDATTATPGCNVVKNVADQVFTLTVGEQESSAVFSVIVNEIQAVEGSALVTVKTESPYVRFYEFTPEGTGVKEIVQTQVNEVKIGNKVRMSVSTTGVYFKSIVVNGKPVTDADFSVQRSYEVVIAERTTIEVETCQKVEVSTANSLDTDSHITIGELFVIDADGNPTNRLECEVGQTITFKAVPTVGYKFDSMEMYYPRTETIENFTYTITEKDAEEGFIMFRATFLVDDEKPSYVIRTNPAYELDENGNPIMSSDAVVGYIYIWEQEGDPEPGMDIPRTTEVVATVGSKIRLLCFAREDYELESFCFSIGYPNSKFPGSYYTVNGDDADDTGVIWITGVLKKIDQSGIGDVLAAGPMAYDRATMTLTSDSAAEIYSVSGTRVLSVEAGSTSLSSLPAGVYIAVSADGKTVKFVK